MKFRIIGSLVPTVEICFEQRGEEIVTQSGSMIWMSEGISMTTTADGGILKGLNRYLAGESIFLVKYKSDVPGTTIAFASKIPGKILPIKMKEYPRGLICQKGAFLCSQNGINLEVSFSKKFSTGIFGGEGFILEKLTGNGIVFLEVDGDVVEKNLGIGEVIKVDTGNVVAFEEGMGYEVEMLKGFKNVFFGGEGLFLTRITGPGKVILQTQNMKELTNIFSKSTNINF